jgi:hypothetical protein
VERTHDESRRAASSHAVMRSRELGHVLAAAFLAGEWELGAMTARARRAVGRRAWLRTVALEVLETYHRAPLDRPRELSAYVEIVLDELSPRRLPRRVLRQPLFHPEMIRAPWPVPRIDTLGDLAAFLELEVGELEWFADVRGIERVVADERLRHYRYVHLPRAGGPPRVIEQPKPRLKALQRRILHEILVPVAESVAEHYRLSRRLATPHLPQGAPTSPALANLAAFSLDRRLTGLAAAVGARYTRYADDLVLSSDHHLRTPQTMIAQIAADEGFHVNAGKTRVMGRGTRQTVTGVVVNAHPNVPRAEYDTLKAILHRALLDGPAGLDPAHLLGRIAWVEALNPVRGAKLRARFLAVNWTPLENR